VTDRRKIPANAKAAEPNPQELTPEELEKAVGGLGRAAPGDRSATGSGFFDEADALFGKTKGVACGDSGNGI
jgi:hypothetical protein